MVVLFERNKLGDAELGEMSISEAKSSYFSDLGLRVPRLMARAIPS